MVEDRGYPQPLWDRPLPVLSDDMQFPATLREQFEGPGRGRVLRVAKLKGAEERARID